MSKLDQLRALREAKQSSRGQTDEAKAREKSQVRGSGRRLGKLVGAKNDDHEKRLQVGVGSERSSPRETKQPHSSTVEQRPLKAPVAGSTPAAAAKRGRPRLEDVDKTLEATKPWEKLGMSRSTWFARQREKREAEKG